MVVAILSATEGARAASSGTDFWVTRLFGQQLLPARLAASSHAVRVYAAGVSLSGKVAWQILRTYQSHILPTDERLFGTPHNLGPVSIVAAPLSGSALGYFDESDLVPLRWRDASMHSNTGNVLYIRAPALMPDRDKMSDFNEVVAHELQHLIDFRIRVMDHHYARESVWLNEGLSFYGQLANGYWTPRDELKVSAAQRDPGWSVSNFDESSPQFAPHARAAYGRAGLFVTYLAARFGPSFIRSLLSTPRVGFSAVDALVRPRRTTAQRVFADWAVSLYVAQKRNALFQSLARPSGHVPRIAVPAVQDVNLDQSSTQYQGLRMRPWGNGYVRFGASGSGMLHVRLHASSGYVRAAVVLQNDERWNEARSYWMRPQPDGGLAFDASHFGGHYDRATVVLSN